MLQSGHYRLTNKKMSTALSSVLAPVMVAIPSVAVALISQAVKRWVLPWLTRQAQVNNAWVVLAVAVLSYLVTLLQGAITGGVDPTATSTFVVAVINFLGATGVYHLSVQTAKAMGVRGVK